MIKCNGCGCSVVFDIDENEGLKDKIINLWNKRANEIIVNMSGDNCQSIGHVDTLTIN